MSLKIAFVCNEYPPAPHGGIGTFVATQAHALGALGHRVFVVGFDPTVGQDQEKDESGIRVIRLRPGCTRTLRLGRYTLDPACVLGRMRLSRVVSEIVFRHTIDLIESHDWTGPLWSKPPAPLVVRLHGCNCAYARYEGMRASRLLDFFERRNVSHGDGLVAVSRHIGCLTLQALRLAGRQFKVVYNGVDTLLFRPQPVPQDSHEVLFVGTISRRKGVPDLLAVIPEVVAQVPTAHFTFAGRLPGGDAGQGYLEKLMALVPSEFRGHVRFTGVVPHTVLPRLYSQAAVVAIPSRAEAFGLTCVEAMACGAAVVMTSRASGPELVEPDETGLLADPTEPTEFAGAIVRLLRDPAFRFRLGSAARQRALTTFAAETTARENVKFYEQVLSQC